MTELATAAQAPAAEQGPSVWILESGEDNEGGSIKGVYTDRDLAADDFLDLVRNLARISRLDVDRSGEDPATCDLYVHGGCDWISLTRYPVATRRQLRRAPGPSPTPGPADTSTPAPTRTEEPAMPITPSASTNALDTADQAQAGLRGKFCPRCERNALYGIECGHCGHVIITALLTMAKPCHPPAWSEGCCPVCFTTDPEVWEVHGRLRCTVCAQGRSRWGDRVKAAPGWREHARRVLAWTDEPGSMSYATKYAPETGGDDDAPEGNAGPISASPTLTQVDQ